MPANVNDFYDAQSARQIAIGQRSGLNDILSETNILQLYIDAAAGSGAIVANIHYNSTVVMNGVTITGSPMTIDTYAVYFNVWSQPDVYQDSQYITAQARMNAIISYFSQLGYSVKRYREGAMNQFYWQIKF